jgi:hypothetical protein
MFIGAAERSDRSSAIIPFPHYGSKSAPDRDDYVASISRLRGNNGNVSSFGVSSHLPHIP